MTRDLMDILLISEAEHFIQQQLETGRFSSVSEVVDAGIRLLEKRQTYQRRFEELRRDVEIGIAQLDRGEVVEGETFMQELRSQMAI
ncbi:type II toxin-antitoxin system ParD family antitoxin [Phormidesmis priestleyi]|uniref:type II toxin-antitoxin system ParD family antitoxin n=1 Tax=Phormidesmis priestleyi TaxID=268141 RepID=UPI001E4C8630|nr:type II toxin-antitoxin system ParD family antitoxin [Phormidesmis priestleyi]